MDVCPDLVPYYALLPKYEPYLRTFRLPNIKLSLFETNKLLYQRTTVLAYIYALDRYTDLSDEEKSIIVLDLLKKYELEVFTRWFNKEISIEIFAEEQSQLDNLYNASYIMLQVIASTNRELLGWVQMNEIRLMELKTANYDFQAVAKFLEANEIIVTEVSEEEKAELAEGLSRYYSDITDASEVKKKRFFKVDYEIAHKLAAARKVFIKEGIVYVAEEQMVGIIGGLCKKHIKRDKSCGFLDNIRRNFVGLGRTLWLHTNVVTVYRDLTVRNYELEINVSRINEYKPLFPPCIRERIRDLEQKRFLKIDGRRQLAIFMKKGGADPDEGTRYIKKLFVEVAGMDPKVFSSEHEYNFEHLFGKRGSKIDYNMNSCRQYMTIRENGSSLCPFAVDASDIEDLGDKLTRWAVHEADKSDIYGLVQDSYCSQACAVVFKSLEGEPPDREILNPIDYYQQSAKKQRITVSASDGADNELTRIEEYLSQNHWRKYIQYRTRREKCYELKNSGPVQLFMHDPGNIRLKLSGRLNCLDLTAMTNFLKELDKKMAAK